MLDDVNLFDVLLAKSISSSGGGGGEDSPVQDVTLNGSSILDTTTHEAEIVADGTYNSSTNKLATESTVINNGAQAVLTGYVKSQTVEDVEATDTVNQAFGKVEKRVSNNENNISALQETIGDINTVLEGVL